MAALAVVAVLFVPACGSDEDGRLSVGEIPTPSSIVAGRASETPPTAASTAGLVRPIGSALGVPSVEGNQAPRPVALTIEALDLDQGPVVSVGVDETGEMEVPGPDQVGWYRFGARPGQRGSAVLAAHVAFDGQDGVFRHLTDLRPGDTIRVDFDDGSAQAFSVFGLRQYDKDQLPVDDLFARDGDPRLVLITCGGSFDASSRSFEDNVVVYAVPS